MVTPEPPVNTVKKAQSRAQTTAVPPGNQPNRALKTRNSRCGAPPSASRTPTRVNSGIDASVGLVESW